VQQQKPSRKISWQQCFYSCKLIHSLKISTCNFFFFLLLYTLNDGKVKGKLSLPMLNCLGNVFVFHRVKHFSHSTALYTERKKNKKTETHNNNKKLEWVNVINKSTFCVYIQNFWLRMNTFWRYVFLCEFFFSKITFLKINLRFFFIT
jgi:hypothetical protein